MKGDQKELYKERVELQTKFDLLLHQLLKSKSLFCVHGDKSGKCYQLKGFKVGLGDKA